MSNADSSCQRGFSLVETVAAMGILALAAIPLMQITTDAGRNAAALESRLFARTVAENVMSRTMATRESLEAGLQTGQETQMGRSFTWTRTVTPAQPGQVQNLTVEVRPAEREQVLARLISLKYIPIDLPAATDATPADGVEP